MKGKFNEEMVPLLGLFSVFFTFGVLVGIQCVSLINLMGFVDRRIDME